MGRSFNVNMGYGQSTIKTIAIPYPTLTSSLTYTGSSQSPTWSGYDAGMMEIAGTTTATDAGTYTAVFTPIGVYVWEDGTQSPYEITWTIGRATISTTPTQSGTLTYTGSSLSPSWSNYDSSQLTIGGTTSGTNAGDYTATFTPTSNYQWSDGSTSAVSVTWTIGRVTISTVPSATGALEWTGSTQSPTWQDYDSSQLTIGGTTSATAEGTYTATFTPTSNYQWSDGATGSVSVEWKIIDSLKQIIERTIEEFNYATESLTTIRNYAFAYCNKLMSVTLTESSVVTLGGSSVFYSTPMSSSGLTGSFGSIYVPASLLSSYQTASYWSSYSSRMVGV